MTTFTPHCLGHALDGKKQVNLLQAETVYKGVFRIMRYTLTHQCFNGETSLPIHRELMIRREAACVLPYNPERQTVVLLQQFRIGALEKTPNPWLIEIIAGVMDDDDPSPEHTIAREALEEAGLEFTHLQKISEYFPSPGGTNEKIHLYIGHYQNQYTSGTYGLAAEHEDIFAFECTLDEALQALHQGQINNAAAMIALLWLDNQLKSHH